MGGTWEKNKVHIATTLLGVLLGSVVTFVFNFHNLSRSLRYEEAHSVLNSTRLAIGFLQNIQTEMDANANLMLNHSYKATFENKPAINQVEMFSSILVAAAKGSTNKVSDADKAQTDAFMNYIKSMAGGESVTVMQLDCPEESLSTIVWDHGAPEIADI